MQLPKCKTKRSWIPVRTWHDAWNDIIRDVIFADDQLKRLMKIPEDTNIIDFIDRYFIRAGFTNNLLTNESVRIVYGDVFSDLQTYKVSRNEMSFDIYVKTEDLHNVEKDRLVLRTNRIAERLIYLLTKSRYTKDYRFWVVHDHDMGTSTIGYVRHNVSFQYLKTY